MPIYLCSSFVLQKGLYAAIVFEWQSSTLENQGMQILKETSEPQTVYKLRDVGLDEVLGEAVVSEIENEFRLHGIFVKPEFRGKGYGKFIMEAFLKEACSKRVTLCTGLGNIGFFKRFGFKVTDIGDSLVHMEKQPVSNKFLRS